MSKRGSSPVTLNWQVGTAHGNNNTQRCTNFICCEVGKILYGLGMFALVLVGLIGDILNYVIWKECVKA